MVWGLSSSTGHGLSSRLSKAVSLAARVLIWTVSVRGRVGCILISGGRLDAAAEKWGQK